MAEEPLKGIKIIDFTQAMAGPFATMVLGDLGAEVIKIEPLSGDQTRHWAPPYTGGMSSYFLSTNRNKKSISLNLKHPGGLEIARTLISKTDVVMENFRPGTMRKFGLDYAAASAINNRIVYCSLSGYGQEGPGSDRPGYDITILANSGLLGLNGERGRPPSKFGVPIADITSGLFAAVSILSSLYEREKSGMGQFIDLSMLDTSVLALTHQAYSYFSTGKEPERLGSAHASIAPYQAFQCRDGYAVIAVGTEKLWERFTDIIGRKDLAKSSRFNSNAKRIENREDLVMEIEKSIGKMSVEETVESMSAAGIPCAPVKGLGDAIADPVLSYRNMLQTMESPYGRLQILGTPFKFSRTPGSVRIPPPELGQDTIDILRSIGIEDEIGQLLESGVIGSGDKLDSDLKSN
ncbi:MAG: CoA transferase [Candidatus Thermoplasmatota archaeon]|nr:CoA transferase [Candidatus Thermoplasmatota archaeon]